MTRQTTAVPHVLRLLGETPGLFATGQPAALLAPGKPLAALAVIAVEPQGATRDDLRGLLWSSLPDQRARASLRQALYIIRRALADHDLQESDGRITLASGAVDVDLNILFQNISEGDFQAATDLWAGGPFSGFRLADAPGFNSWADRVGTRAEGLLVGALTGASRSAIDRGDLRGGLRCLEWARDIQPYNEDLHRGVFEVLLDLERLPEARAALDRMLRDVDELSPDVLDDLDYRLRTLEAEPAAQVGEACSPTMPFVGRTAEVAILRGLWREARAGRARVVALMGQMGVGKTRLTSEFIRSSVGRHGIHVRVGATHVGRGVHLGAVSQLAKELVCKPGGAGISRASYRVIESLVPSIATGGGGGTLVVPSPEAAVGDALVDLMEAVSEESPLVIVLDDVQWMDPRSQIILLWAARALRNSRTLVLITARSDALESSVQAGIRSAAQGSSLTLIELNPLSTAECIEGLTLELHAELEPETRGVFSRLCEASGGNPLFLGELLRQLTKDGVIQATDDGWAVDYRRFPDSPPLPTSLSELLLLRLAGLEEPLRRTMLTMAAAAAPLSAGELQGKLRRDLQSTLERHVTVLISQGLLRRMEDGRVAVAHDAVRRAALSFRERERQYRWRSPKTVMGLVAAAIVAVVLAGQVFPLRYASSSRLFGGGRLVLDADTALLLFRPPVVRGGAWELVQAIPISRDDQLIGSVLLGPEGTVYGHLLASDGRQRAQWIQADGGLRPVLANQGDSNVLDVAPDGEHLLLAVGEDVGGHWIRRLVHYSPRERRTHTLRTLSEGGTAIWLPDASGVLASFHGVTDSVVRIAPDGLPVWARAMEGSSVLQLAACGDADNALVVSVGPGETPTLVLLGGNGESLDAIRPVLPAVGRVACSPHGGAVAYDASVDGVRRTVVQDLSSGDTVLGPVGSGTLMEWRAENRMPVPVAVDLEQRSIGLPWGQHIAARARLIMSDGSQRSDTLVRWQSLDPHIAYVSAEGVVYGASEGSTLVVATANRWLADTLAVTVSAAAAPAEALFVDRFDGLDTLGWYILGDPKPTPVELAIRTVLDLRGDGIGNDGMVSRRGFQLPRGGTLELEYRLVLTRQDRQQFGICLSRFEDEASLDKPVSPIPVEYVCFSQPVGELDSFNPSSFSLFSSYPIGRLSLPQAFPASDWRQVAIVLAPDGVARLLVDRKEVSRLPAPLNFDPSAFWHIEIVRRAADTELLVRDLVLWDGMRY